MDLEPNWGFTLAITHSNGHLVRRESEGGEVVMMIIQKEEVDDDNGE